MNRNDPFLCDQFDTNESCSSKDLLAIQVDLIRKYSNYQLLDYRNLYYEFLISDTLTRSNEDEEATMSLFLKSNNDYVYLTFGITFSVLTIIVTFVLKNM